MSLKFHEWQEKMRAERMKEIASDSRRDPESLDEAADKILSLSDGNPLPFPERSGSVARVHSKR